MVLQSNSASIAQKSNEIWTVQADLQPISFKSHRLLNSRPKAAQAQSVKASRR